MLRKMIFFDFDYTLAKTTENVWVWSPRGTRSCDGKYYRTVNPLEYSTLELANDEHIDESSFTEFNKIDISGAEPLKFSMYLLDFFMSEENNIVFILSARPQIVENCVFRFLKKHNVKNFEKISFKGCSSSDPSKKYDFIKQKTLELSPLEVFLFDDSRKVIEYAKSFFPKDFTNIELTTCLVNNDNNSTCMCFE